jgi:P-type Na+/K+ transporter
MAAEKDSDNGNYTSGQSNMALSLVAHTLERDVLVKEIRSDVKDGLSEAEAKKRLEEFGRNELDNGPAVQPLRILITQGETRLQLPLQKFAHK